MSLSYLSLKLCRTCDQYYDIVLSKQSELCHKNFKLYSYPLCNLMSGSVDYSQ